MSLVTGEQPMDTTVKPLESITSDPRFADLKVIDVDTHWSEPPDLWTARAPSAFRNKVPRIAEKDGSDFWVIGEEATVIQKASPASVVGKDGSKRIGGDFLASLYGDVHEASWNLVSRVGFMDRLGIQTQILYPNVGGLGYTYFRSDDKALKNLCTAIYNDAAVEIQESTKGRVLPMAVIPFWDIGDALKEIERTHAMGLHGIVLGGDVQTIGMPDLGQDYWTPMWEMCESLGIPVNFHIGGSQLCEQTLKNASWPSFGTESWLALGSAMMYVDNARVIGNLIYAGVPERFPRLKLVSVESGVGWIPFYLQALDYQMTENAPSEAARLSMKPSEYFKRNFYASFWFERGLEHVLEYLGTDHVMFETDFPHPTCLYPGPLEHVRASVAHLGTDTRRKLMQDNAARLYKIRL
jgi:predicted TIM-barrel fold metal-dependent hydrolase